MLYSLKIVVRHMKLLLPIMCLQFAVAVDKEGNDSAFFCYKRWKLMYNL